MPTVGLDELTTTQREQLATTLLRAARQHAPEWIPDLAAAREELEDALAPDVHARVFLDENGLPLGFAAVRHLYGRLWELHPLVVDPTAQGRGFGRHLVTALERWVIDHDGLVMWVSTSDETRATSLTGVDLYADPLEAMRTLEVEAGHAIRFWQHLGYRLVGLAPDAEGHGRPSIHLAKRMGPRVALRPFVEADASAVHELVASSFAAGEFGHQGEAALVERLRVACPDRIELVAEVFEEEGSAPVLIGHVLLTPATLHLESGEIVAGLGLAPVSVAVAHQRRGVGKRLISDGLGLARRRACPFVLVLGHPDYYPRFGFEQASTLGVACPYPGVPDEAFMIAVLDPSRREALRGRAAYHPAFDE